MVNDQQDPHRIAAAQDPGDRLRAEVADEKRQRFRWLDLLRTPHVGGEQQRLRVHVANAGKILPPKGPIHGFVAQNPLQGLEHLPFDRAVREAQHLLKGQGYLSNEAFRRIYASGRITRDNLRRAVRTHAPHLAGRPSIEVRGRQLEAVDICLAQMHHPIDPLSHGTLRWQVSHAKSIVRFRQDLPRETRAHFLDQARRELHQEDHQALEAYAVSTLWAAVLAALGLGDQESLENAEARTEEVLLDCILGVARDGGMPIPVTDAMRAVIEAEVKFPSGRKEWRLCQRVVAGLRQGELSADGFKALENLLNLRGTDTAWRRRLTELRQNDPRIDLARRSHEALERDFGRIGTELTLADFCQRVTGVRIAGMINDQMIGWCAAFLDEGLAGWPMPYREGGLYDAWRKLAERDFTFMFMGVDNPTQKIRQLPAHPEETVILILRTMGIPEEIWSGYLTLHLGNLPGWAGMVKWREAHPDYEMQERFPIDLTQYLAVCLFYELELVTTLCRREWGIKGTIPALRRYFSAHPEEYFARFQIAEGDLPDALASGVLRADQGRIMLNWDAFTDPAYGDMHKARGLSRADQWSRFAEMLYVYRNGAGSHQDTLRAVYHDAWRLFQLAQVLGLSAEDISALAATGEAKALLALLDDFPPAAHGPIWLQAYESHYREQLLSLLNGNRATAEEKGRPSAQMVFCLDVREEGIRRHVEAQGGAYETFGTAGFFSMPIIFRPFSDGAEKDSCPIVIKPRHTVVEVARPGQAARDRERERRTKWKDALHALYHRLETNFATAYYLIDLLGIPFGFAVTGRTLLPRKWRALTAAIRTWVIRPTRTFLLLEGHAQGEPREELPVSEGQQQEEMHLRHHPPQRPQVRALGFSLEEQADLVEAQLRMIGLTRQFARLIVFFGHGSTTENNPYAAGYHCGACGGNRGGPNGRAIAVMANNPAVRALLRRRGLLIPDDTYVIGGEHDTAADRFTYYDTEEIPSTYREEFRRLTHALSYAASLHAQERCQRLPLAPGGLTPEQSLLHVHARSLDWAQVYPEWGHARCALMVIGRRDVTRGLALDRRAYLQSYDSSQDPDGAILEEIMTAFIPVVRGISLDYYFSYVDSGITGVFGAGTKTIHNVVGLIGVMQGAGGDLKPGLPLQGVAPLHEPMRVQIIIESSPAKIAPIVERHTVLGNLFKNQWAHLIAWDPETKLFVGYRPDGTWEALQSGEALRSRSLGLAITSS